MDRQTGSKYRRTLGVLASCALFVVPAIIPLSANAQGQSSRLTSQSHESSQAAEIAIISQSNQPLAGKSDQELTELTARWSELRPGQRRALLAEVRGRMARNASDQAAASNRPKLNVRVLRRYGRVVRKPDGRVVLQTRIVQLTPQQRVPSQGASSPAATRSNGAASSGTIRRGRITFGFGFERRSQAQQAPPAADQTAGAGNSSHTIPPARSISQDEPSANR